jgi:hypothetical protein
MIEINIIMNSSMEEILSARCTALHGQNLEIHVYNKGKKPISMAGYFILENSRETYKCENLFPPWKQIIQPQRATAFYCNIDENVWEKYDKIILFDNEGTPYSFPTGNNNAG